MRLNSYLGTWCERCPRPVVLFLDEIDALSGKTLLAVLQQLRAGYRSRPEGFPHAMALIGLRDVRDYRVRDAPEVADNSAAARFPTTTRMLAAMQLRTKPSWRGISLSKICSAPSAAARSRSRLSRELRPIIQPMLIFHKA